MRRNLGLRGTRRTCALDTRLLDRRAAPAFARLLSAPMDLIRVRDGHFDDNGSRFKIVGANNYYAGFATDAMRNAVLHAAKRMGLNVLRVPAFLDTNWRGAYFQSWNPATSRPEVNCGENGLEHLDHLIADAERSGIRLILPLVNHWPDFGGMDRYAEW